MIFLAANPFTQAFVEADFLGRMIFFGLFILSFMCWSLLLYKLWINYQLHKDIPTFEKIFVS